MAAVPVDRKSAAATEVWRVVWSDGALENVADISTYIRTFNPRAAARLELDIIRACEGLSTMPDRGRPISRGRRELTITVPYVIQYIVVGDEVRILSIRHSARRPEG